MGPYGMYSAQCDPTWPEPSPVPPPPPQVLLEEEPLLRRLLLQALEQLGRQQRLLRVPEHQQRKPLALQIDTNALSFHGANAAAQLPRLKLPPPNLMGMDRN